ncbi:hypothetical protein [Herbaspirillum sp. CF444]|uniref:hypothetical protein n=1 Tax=Herbaspirillum sp. CF444 TaxID=1144319 RepID=UPI0012F79600|nr:hypothetical protein [Herbaspirillum sp. CF444]
MKYAAIRATTQTYVEEEWLAEQRERIVVTALNSDAQSHFDRYWRNHPQRLVSFDWFGSIKKTLDNSHPRRLEFAFWKNKILCGLVVGRISKGGQWLSVTHIEGYPDASHPLKGKIIALALFAADVYSVATKSEARGFQPRVRLLDPVPQVIAAYQNLGYSDVVVTKKLRYMTKPYIAGVHHEDTTRKS